MDPIQYEAEYGNLKGFAGAEWRTVTTDGQEASSLTEFAPAIRAQQSRPSMLVCKCGCARPASSLFPPAVPRLAPPVTATPSRSSAAADVTLPSATTIAATKYRSLPAAASSP